MHSAPIVSVIIPTHNRAAMLRRAIDSVVNQTYADLELIVVDDASTDETPEVVKSISDPRLRYFRHEVSRHASAARNTGLAHARGAAIAFLDDDDEWLPGKLEAQMAVLEQAPEQVAVVYCWMDYYADGRVVGERHPQLRGNIFAQTLPTQPIGNSSTLLVRRAVIERVGGFDESLPRGNDGDFIRRVCREFEVEVVPQVLVKVHTGHADRITTLDEQGWENRILGLTTKLRKFESDLKHLPPQRGEILLQLGEAYLMTRSYGKALGSFARAALATGFQPATVRRVARLARGHFGSTEMANRLNYALKIWPRVQRRTLREMLEVRRQRSRQRSGEPVRVIYMTGLPRTGTSLMKNYFGDFSAFYVMSFQPDGFLYAWREAQSQERIVIDKATHTMRSLDRIFRAYGSAAAFCCIIRDPRDALLSLLDQPRLHREAPRDRRFWRYWARHYQTYLDFAASHPEVRCMLLRYEDLVRHPIESKRAFLEWAGVPYDPERISAAYRLAHAGDIQDPKVRRQSVVSPQSLMQWQRATDVRARQLLATLQDRDVLDLMLRFGYTADGFGEARLQSGVGHHPYFPTT